MKKLTILLAAAIVIVSCKKKDDDNTTTPANDPYATQKSDLKTTYANIAFAMYSDALTSAQVLDVKLEALVNNPSAQALTDARQAWFEAREAYGQTEVFRFVDGPIDNPSDGPEGLINAWPMDEAYVDYVDGDATAGIINDLVNYPVIDAEAIVNANEFGSESNVSTGYHAIEFLLWGQDLSTTGPGARVYTDYVTGGTNSNQARRGQYLLIVGDLLINALEDVKNEWDPAGNATYRQTFLAMNSDVAFRKMFNSMRVLAGDELRGERVNVAYENADQEDEHSCFSDNTHRDIWLNARGIYDLYIGTYTKTDGSVIEGYSVSDLVAEKNATLNNSLIAQFELTQTTIEAMHNPFDRAIVEPAYRPGVAAVIDQLGTETDLLTEAAAEFDIVF